MLTTHLIDLCKKLESNTKIQNMYMNVEEDGDDFIYTYIFEKGISTIKGGVKVLIDLDYPKEIVDMAKDYLKNDI
jgi:DNA mismatch repair ATPase MutS